MEIKLAKSAGFCFGVKRAVDTVYSEAGNNNVYTFGEIIHNDEVVKELSERGVKILNSEEELDRIENATVVIRAHGAPKRVFDRIDELNREGRNIRISDATCPFVKKIYNICSKAESENASVIIAGDASHPEIIGILGWLKNPGFVVNSAEDIANLPIPEKSSVYLVSQTTYNFTKFQELVDLLQRKEYNVSVVNTICNATKDRQEEARELSKASDAMIVIGGEHSSNTRKLFEISASECKNTYYIQTLGDLDLERFRSLRSVGITAGASTPNNIIKEVLRVMSENDFASMFEETIKSIHNGEVIEGTVIGVKEDQVAVDIGYKSDGIITKSEYTSDNSLDLTTVVNIGDKITVKVLKVNDGEGFVALTYKRLAAERGSKRLEEAFNNKEVLKAKVAEVRDGGLSVIVDETRIFIPASLVSDTFEKNLEKYKDQEIEFVLTEFNPKRRRVIGDRKQLLTAKRAEAMKVLFEKIKIGDTITGKVKNVTDFGAFIDLGGADGLLHISEMSWGRVENPKKVFKVDDEVTAFIKDIQGEKIALSLKFPEANPWAGAEEKFAVGNVVTGKVARMTDFGAFVELVPGVDALLHVSQIAKNHIEKPSDVLSVGQEVEAKIVDFNLENHKISLSIKALAPETEEAPAEEAPVEE